MEIFERLSPTYWWTDPGTSLDGPLVLAFAIVLGIVFVLAIVAWLLAPRLAPDNRLHQRLIVRLATWVLGFSAVGLLLLLFRWQIVSLGVVLYYLSAGRCPFESPGAEQLISQHLDEQPPPIREVAPGADCPPALEAVILKCLAKDPDQRYDSMRHVLRVLEQVELPKPVSDPFRRRVELLAACPRLLGGPGAPEPLADDPDAGSAPRRHAVAARHRHDLGQRGGPRRPAGARRADDRALGPARGLSAACVSRALGLRFAAMTPALTWLTASALFGLGDDCRRLRGPQSALDDGRVAPRLQQPRASPRGQRPAGRADRAAKNMLENFLLFSALVLAAHAGGRAGARVDLGARIFFFARLAYFPI